MTKRNMQDSNKRSFDEGDNPIGLTSAFEVIRDPQAVEYDTNDNSIGLTEAFGAVSPNEEEGHSWDEAGKWRDFDWDSVPDVDETGAIVSGGQEDEPSASQEAAPSGTDPVSTSDETDATSADSAAAPPEPADAPSYSETSQAPAGKPSSTGAMAAVSAAEGSKRGGRGRHAAPDPELSPRMKKSKRTRKVLIVVVILVILLIGALGYFMYKTVTQSQEEATQQAQEQVGKPKDSLEGESGNDNVETSSKLTDVPKITPLLGKTADEAVEMLGRGALITQNRDVDEKGSAVKTTMNVALTEEPADSKTGTPTVYLGLNKKGKIIQVGYSASASALGFGSLSFADAIMSEHVVEKTLAKVGVEVPEGSAVLPKDKKKYSTYASDGTTVVKERCSFHGDTKIDGSAYEWSAVLSYDYTTQVVTGDLADTVRIIYVYVTKV